jgi:hypothetical protein
LNYRAAAIALGYLHSDLRSGHAQPSIQALLATMANWRGLFSPDGTPYRSLNRTLMNLPGNVPPELVCQLSKIRLERPMLNPLELNTLLLYVSAADAARAEAGPHRFRIFHHATAAEIADAVKRIATHTNRTLHPRRLDDLRFVVRYLCDYPETFHGTLAGFVERVIRWHRHAHERERVERQIMQLGGYDQSVAPPPIPVPMVSGVTFLNSVGQIVEEGERMHHCIATRVQDALHGRCYLFHIDHQGRRASVEVSAQGQIAQAQGPHNTDNAAVSWGATQLRAWGARLYVHELFPSASPVRRVRRGRAVDPNQLALPF